MTWVLGIIIAIVTACVTLVVYALIINGSVTTREQVLEDRVFRYRRALLKIYDESRDIKDAKSVAKFALNCELIREDSNTLYVWGEPTPPPSRLIKEGNTKSHHNPPSDLHAYTRTQHSSF